MRIVVSIVVRVARPTAVLLVLLASAGFAAPAHAASGDTALAGSASSTAPAVPAAPAASTRRYAVIVVNNRSLEPGLAPLSFADDDGAKYYELFTSLGAEVALLGVLDPDAQRRFPQATAAARPPSSRELSRTLDSFFARMRADAEAGVHSELYFVYSGHGSLGHNREGMIALLDRSLGRADLYREVIARSPATFNHVILDACYAYFMVEKKGMTSARTGEYRDTVLGFLAGEELARYPNTGVILATTEDAETHEWARWQAGVFSHELTSAMLGAGDVDGDGAVTYAEAAAAVEAANAAIEDPRTRLRVYARPPATRIDQPLIDLLALSPAAWLEVGRELAGHASVEDARGVRVADLNPSGEAEVQLALIGQAPFFLRREDLGLEAEIVAQGEGARLAAGHLSFRPLAESRKGAIEQSFRRKLFAVGFGPSFYRGVLAMAGPGIASWDGWYGSARPMDVAPGVPGVTVPVAAPPASPATPYRRVFGYLSLGVAAGSAIGGVLFIRASDDTYGDYQRAVVPSEAVRLREKGERETLAGNLLLGVGGAAALAGATLLIWDWLAPSDAAVFPVAATSPGELGFGIAGRF